MWTARVKLARLLGFDIPRLLGQIETSRREASRLQDRIDTLEAEVARARAQPAVLFPDADPAAGITAAKRLRDLLTGLLDSYELTNGLSCDAYCDTPQWHAMAEAQYLETVAIAHSAGLISDGQAAQKARTSVARLRAGALHRETGDYAQWGLGFRWQDFPADAPFLVTTALVTRALMAANGLAAGVDLAREGLTGIARLPRRAVSGVPDLRVPVYALGLEEVVENTVALWAQVTLTGSALLEPGAETLRDAERALDWLDRRFVPGLGWAYSEKRPVFDLMHQVYILEGLRAYPHATDVEARAIEVFAGFRTGEGYIDSLTLTTRTKALETAERSGGQYVVFRGEHVLSARTEPARLWSVGGMLGCFGLLAVEGAQRSYWLSQIRRFPFQMLPTRFGADFRQEMHLARGAALALKALRG